MSTTRWSLVVSEATDRALRTFLASRALKKGHFSQFVEDAPRLADLAGRPPGRRRVHTCAAAGGPSLNRPGGSGTEATTAPQPRIKQVPQGVAEHV